MQFHASARFSMTRSTIVALPSSLYPPPEQLDIRPSISSIVKKYVPVESPRLYHGFPTSEVSSVVEEGAERSDGVSAYPLEGRLWNRSCA